MSHILYIQYIIHLVLMSHVIIGHEIEALRRGQSIHIRQLAITAHLGLQKLGDLGQVTLAEAILLAYTLEGIRFIAT